MALNNNSKPYSDLPAGIIVHYFALMAWNGMSSEEALKEVNSKNYDELNKLTNADYSIMTALNEIQKKLFVGFTADSMEEIVRGDVYEAGTNYLSSIGQVIYDNNKERLVLVNKIMDINKEIHNKWVKENAIKYNRDQNKDDKRLFQHLPQELIGIDEVNKDFLFMAPLLKKFKLGIGEMKEEPYGSFECNTVLKLLYNTRVKQFLKDNHIESSEDLKKYLKNIANNYDALKPENAPAGKENVAQSRINYMTSDDKIDKLVGQVISNNKEIFAGFTSTKTM